MSLTKREAAHLAALEAELAQLRAMHVEMVAPEKDVPVPKDGIALGWDYNAGRMHDVLGAREAVYPVSSEPSAHRVGRHVTVHDHVGGGWSQRGIPSYSTRRRALQALRAEVCRQHAGTLAKIDSEIEKEPS